MFLANRIINKEKGFWTEQLREHTNYTDAQLRCCAKDMCILIAGIEKCSLQTVRKKFSLTRYNQVATIKIEHWVTYCTVSDHWMTQIREWSKTYLSNSLSLIVPYINRTRYCLSKRGEESLELRIWANELCWPISYRVCPADSTLITLLRLTLISNKLNWRRTKSDVQRGESNFKQQSQIIRTQIFCLVSLPPFGKQSLSLI